MVTVRGQGKLVSDRGQRSRRWRAGRPSHRLGPLPLGPFDEEHTAGGRARVEGWRETQARGTAVGQEYTEGCG